ncbi:MAG: polyprenol monophosphomannose synthase [Desulfobacterales bacterium]|nr:polyprenol monophosphomannose synthase [Desulfobacterales bacterium]
MNQNRIAVEQEGHFQAKTMAMIPTYNEAGNIERLIQEVLAVSNDISVVVVDDDSPDGTGKILDRMRETNPRVHVIHRIGIRGRGTAGIEGFQYALREGADYVIEMDGDFSHKPVYIPLMLKEMDTCDVVIGSRLLKEGGESGRNIMRTWVTQLANIYIRIILNLKIKDCTSGFRVFRRDVLEAIDLNSMISSGPSIVQEVLYKAYKKGFKIKEVPIVFEERMSGESTFNFRIIRESLLKMFVLRFRF